MARIRQESHRLRNILETEKLACVNKAKVQVTNSGNSNFDETVTSPPAFQSRTYQKLYDFSTTLKMVDKVITAPEASNASGESS